jgi:hypothetical protein
MDIILYLNIFRKFYWMSMKIMMAMPLNQIELPSLEIVSGKKHSSFRAIKQSLMLQSTIQINESVWTNFPKGHCSQII